MSSPTRLSGRELDALVASAATVADSDLADFVDSVSARALYDSLVSEGLGPAELVALPRRHGRRSNAPALVAAAVLIVVAVLGSLLAFRSPPLRRVLTGIEVGLSTKSGAEFIAVLPKQSVPHGIPDWQSMPEYVQVDVAGQVVGQVRRTDLDQSVSAGPSGASGASGTSGAGGFACGEGGVPVLNGQMKQVGSLYPGAGYVPLGQTPVCGQTNGSPSLSTIVPSQQCAVAITGSGQVNITQCGTAGGGETKGG